jgi:hypothetical protein
MTIDKFIQVIFRIFFVYIFFDVLLQSISIFITLLSQQPDVLLILIVGVAIILFLFLSYWLISNSNYIITLLKVNKGFEGEIITFQHLNERSILQLGFCISGGVIFFGGLPDVLVEVYSLFSYHAKNRVDDLLFGQNPSVIVMDFIKSCIRLSIGYLLFNNSKWIANKLLPVESNESNSTGDSTQ